MLLYLCRSDELRVEYDRLKGAMEKALEANTFAMSKRKALQAELRQLAQEREALEKHGQIMNNLKDARVKAALRRLQVHEARLEEIRHSLDQAHQALEQSEGSRELRQSEQVLQQAKKRYARAQKEHATAERQVRKLQTDLDALAPAAMEREAKLSQLQSRTTSLAESLPGLREELEQRQLVMRQQQSQLNALADAREQLLAQAPAPIQLTVEQEAEYERLRQELQQKAGKELLKLETAQRQMAPLQGRIRQLESRLTETQQRLAQVSQQQQGLAPSQSSLQSQAQAALERAEALRHDLATQKAQRKRWEQQQAELTDRLRQVVGRLGQAGQALHETQRDTQARHALATLRRLFPGVRGRLADLARPSERRYEAALSLLLGKHLDAIVVEHERTAIECIQVSNVFYL